MEHVDSREGLGDVVGVGGDIGDLVDVVHHVRSLHGGVGTGGQGQRGSESSNETHVYGREYELEDGKREPWQVFLI